MPNQKYGTFQADTPYIMADTRVTDDINSMIIIHLFSVLAYKQPSPKGGLLMDAATQRERKKEIIAYFGNYIPEVVIWVLRQRQYHPSRREFDEIVQQATWFVMRHVKVEGKNWQPDQCRAQVDQLLQAYLSNLHLTQ
jgi:hypothetical protein